MGVIVCPLVCRECAQMVCPNGVPKWRPESSDHMAFLIFPAFSYSLHLDTRLELFFPNLCLATRLVTDPGVHLGTDSSVHLVTDSGVQFVTSFGHTFDHKHGHPTTVQNLRDTCTRCNPKTNGTIKHGLHQERQKWIKGHGFKSC